MHTHTLKIKTILFSLILTCTALTGCSESDINTYINDIASMTSEITSESDTTAKTSMSNTDIPKYTGNAYVEINNNKPTFTNDEITTNSFESYSDLDELGRCGIAEACIGTDIMPTEKRGQIGQIKPSGWHTVKYPEYISDNYLYNRCHLIGYQLTGENANEKNLITGTRYLNITGMLPFENEVADYIKETNNHVMYRVTPLFVNDELVARGVYIEAYSVEDDGSGVSYNVYCFNIQPHITIDYATGDSYVTKEQIIKNVNAQKYVEGADYFLMEQLRTIF